MEINIQKLHETLHSESTYDHLICLFGSTDTDDFIGWIIENFDNLSFDYPTFSGNYLGLIEDMYSNYVYDLLTIKL